MIIQPQQRKQCYDAILNAVTRASQLDAKGGPRQREKARQEREMARLWLIDLDQSDE